MFYEGTKESLNRDVVLFSTRHFASLVYYIVYTGESKLIIAYSYIPQL